MHIREIINLVEAAHLYGSTFWFNPENSQVIACGDHGECVAREPWRFGLGPDIQSEMEAAIQPPEDGNDVPYEMDDNDASLREPVARLWGDPDGWSANDAWDGRYATYVSSSNAKSVWLAVNHLNRQGSLTDKLEIEVSRPQDARFVYLGDETIDQFLRAGTRGAENFLARLDKRRTRTQARQPASWVFSPMMLKATRIQY